MAWYLGALTATWWSTRGEKKRQHRTPARLRSEFAPPPTHLWTASFTRRLTVDYCATDSSRKLQLAEQTAAPPTRRVIKLS